MNSPISLEPFCDPTRPGLDRPFSRGAWTYATNGHVAVRVNRRDDIAENPAAPDAEKLFSLQFIKKGRRCYAPAPKLQLSEPFEWIDEIECRGCGGSGKKHDCPNCQCDCSFCDGTGKQALPQFQQVALGHAHYKAKYLYWLQTLPGLELGPTQKRKPLSFRFEGGEGLLMPCAHQTIRAVSLRSDGAGPQIVRLVKD
jgi:hypothetical protein